MGRVLRVGVIGVTVPPPGWSAGVDRLEVDGADDGFQVEVASDGTVAYSVEDVKGDGNVLTVSADPGACADGAYSTEDLKEYGTYNWWIGDGGMPGALSRSDAQQQFASAISHINTGHTNCDLTTTNGGKAAYQGTTTKESDMNSSGDCTDRDSTSTWDAGDLPSGTVAQTCFWSWPSPGVKNDLREADVRYNTHDNDFTANGGGAACLSQFDIQAVGTHEAGHVFGLGHVGVGHSHLTMYDRSFRCSTAARSLGYGDLRGLWSIYE